MIPDMKVSEEEEQHFAEIPIMILALPMMHLPRSFPSTRLPDLVMFELQSISNTSALRDPGDGSAQ